MRIHLLALPNVQTTSDYGLDGFCTRTRLFAALLKRLGHTVLLYASEENDAVCDEVITCISKADQQALLGATPYQAYVPDAASPLCVQFNAVAARAVRLRKQHGDWIATIGGSAQLPVWEQNPEMGYLEYSIGYRGVCPASTARVFQSHAWRHVVHGFMGVDGARVYDDVIYPWFDVDQFPVVTRPESYIVYCGRLGAVKGLPTVCHAARAAGVRLVVMGHGDPSVVTYGEYRGAVSDDERNTLLANASACLMPTDYIEPFGNVAAEAQLCGTPVIGPNIGAFTESIAHGVTGYRCRYLGEYVQAIHDAPRLDRRAIRARAVRLFSTDAADAAYRAYFARLELMRADGWASLQPPSDTWHKDDHGHFTAVAGTTDSPEEPTGWDQRYVGAFADSTASVA